LSRQFSGEVNKTVVVGLNVQPGQQLLTVVPLDQVWVTAQLQRNAAQAYAGGSEGKPFMWTRRAEL